MATVAAPTAAVPRPHGLVFPLGLLAGAAATAATVAALGHDPPQVDRYSLSRGLAVASYVAVGVYMWSRRPSSRFGASLAAVGLTYAVAALSASNVSAVHSVGRIAHAFWLISLAYLFLCYPRDHLKLRSERVLIGLMAGTTVLSWLVVVPIAQRLPSAGPLAACAEDCPANSFQLVETPDWVTHGLNVAVNAMTALFVLGLVLLLVGKARGALRLRRQVIVPLIVCVAALGLNYAAFTVLVELDVRVDALRILGAAAALAIPPALLLGQLRGRVFAASTFAALASGIDRDRVTPRGVELLLREALGDPSLALVLRSDAGEWLDADGAPIAPPSPSRDVEVTYLHRGGRVVAAIVHDQETDDDAALMEGLTSTAVVLLDNARLIDELRASRARIVAAAHDERLRLERDLHDGAQQRLLAIQLKLRALRAQYRDDGDALDEVSQDASAAVEELRRLSHGLYPPILRERGLGDAIRAFARAAPLPVVVVADGERCRGEVEEAVYFSVLEATQNVGKHAHASKATITIERQGTDLAFTVVDDGVGFDQSTTDESVGLLHMRDRLGAIGGGLTITSRAGAGTTVRGLVPGAFA